MELLIAIALLGIFMFVAARVFGSTMKIIRTDAAHDDLTRSLDSAVAQLRRDVWTATGLGMRDEMLIVSNPDGVVHWSVDSANHRLSRTMLTAGRDTTDEPKTWSTASATIRFDVSANTLRATITPAKGARPATETFTSQVLLAGSGS